MKSTLITLLSALLLTIGAAPAEPVLAQGSDCLSNRAIQDAIAAGEIAPLARVLASAGVGADAEILSVRVCRDGGGYNYIVAVMGRNGNARNLTLPARN